MRVLGMIATLALAAFNSVAVAGACDATTGASFKVSGISTTLNSAVITWTEGHSNGDRYVQHGTTTLGTARKVQTRASGAKKETISGLVEKTKYQYKFYGVYKGSTKSVVTGTFTTDGSVCGNAVPTTTQVHGYVLNQVGDSIENVKVSIDSAGKIIATDTTDGSGHYNFDLKAGDYKVQCAYQPFTSPAAYSAKAVLGTVLLVPTQVLTGAFQLGSTVKLAPTGTGVANATVTVKSTTDATMTYTKVTDVDGHFSLGLKAGEYSVTAISGTKTLAQPLKVALTAKSLELPDMLLTATVGIKLQAKSDKFNASPTLDYDAKGARQLEKSTGPVQAFRIVK